MRRNAFLVEDQPVLRARLTQLLSRHAGIDVVGTSTGATDAAMWLNVHRDAWDLAIVDLSLAEGNGLTVVAGCRVRKFHQRVIVLSSFATPAMRRRCACYGADAVFDKSTELNDLMAYLGAL